jgi:hypothetical protein
LLDPNNPKYRCGKALTNKEKIKWNWIIEIITLALIL